MEEVSYVSASIAYQTSLGHATLMRMAAAALAVSLSLQLEGQLMMKIQMRMKTQMLLDWMPRRIGHKRQSARDTPAV
jgi:hypothetical protein